MRSSPYLHMWGHGMETVADFLNTKLVNMSSQQPRHCVSTLVPVLIQTISREELCVIQLSRFSPRLEHWLESSSARKRAMSCLISTRSLLAKKKAAEEGLHALKVIHQPLDTLQHTIRCHTLVSPISPLQRAHRAHIMNGAKLPQRQLSACYSPNCTERDCRTAASAAPRQPG